MVCEQIVNADQSLMEVETLGKKRTSSFGTNSFSCDEGYIHKGFRSKNWSIVV
jgi:hypothetical protein